MQTVKHLLFNVTTLIIQTDIKHSQSENVTHVYVMLII